jgi:uncharacterized membrane protein
VWFLALMVFGAVVAFPLIALARAVAAERAVRELSERVRALEARAAGGSEVAPPDLAVINAEPLHSTLPSATPTPLPTTPPSPPRPPRTLESLEEQIGGVWLQNVASVLILLGVFFLIVWGFTTGRIGPQVLVAAGVMLGFALVWRGDRVARHLPRFGHALIGLGLGAAYVSLYLGRFTLNVLDENAGFVLLTTLALATVALGLHYGAQSVGALGVIGAFVPPLIAAWAPLRGFSMAPGGMLLYLGFVNAVVLALGMRAGWHALPLSSLVLTAVTWSTSFTDKHWSWPVQIGLSAIYLLVGLAPLVQFGRTSERVPPLALLVAASAPVLFLFTAWPFLAEAHRSLAAMQLFALAAIYLGGAAWSDTTRPERDLWRPLTGAATVYVTAGLQRLVGAEWTPLAWCTEAALLMVLGLDPRSGWLRLCGYVVGALGGIGVLIGLVETHPRDFALVPVFHVESLRLLASLAVLALAAWHLARRRERLSNLDRSMPEVITACVNVLLIVWSVREADHAANALAAPAQVHTLAAGLSSGAWALQAAALFTLGWARQSPFLRWAGLMLFGLTVFKFLAVDLATVDAFWRFLVAIGVGVMLLAVSYVYQRRRRES